MERGCNQMINKPSMRSIWNTRRNGFISISKFYLNYCKNSRLQVKIPRCIIIVDAHGCTDHERHTSLSFHIQYPTDHTDCESAKMNEYPEDEYFEDHPSSMARRRRERRKLTELNDEAADTLGSLELRTSFNLEFFLSCLLTGVLVGVGVLLDSPIILLSAAALAPIMSPITRISLSITLGSFGLFLQSLAGFLVGGGLIFAFSFGIGMLSKVWRGLSISQALVHAHLTIPDILILILAIVWMTIVLIRSEHKPVIPSILIAYLLALPLAVAGYGLGRGESLLWPDGLYVFVVNLSVVDPGWLLYLDLRRSQDRNHIDFGMGSRVYFYLLLSLDWWRPAGS